MFNVEKFLGLTDNKKEEKYPKYVNTEKGLVKEDDEDKPDSPGRRKFLGGAAATAGVVVGSKVIPKFLEDDLSNKKSHNFDTFSTDVPETKGSISEPEKVIESVDETEEEMVAEEEAESNIEKDPSGLNVFQQFEEFDELVSMEAAVEAMYNERFHELAETLDGRARLTAIALRFKQYDADRLLEPFKERDIEEWLAIALPSHESDWLSRTSSAGAVGTHQLMPETIERMDYKLSDAKDPYMASEITAEYLKQARKRFGDDVYMQLYEYVAGANLVGFRKTKKDKKDWTRENLNIFVGERLNKEYLRLKDEGFVFSKEPVYAEHLIKKGDTMWNISKSYGMSVEVIAQENNIKNPSLIQADATLRIPYKNNLEKELRTRNYNTFHMIEYSPHLIAMQDALASRGHTVARKTLDKGGDVQVASR